MHRGPPRRQPTGGSASNPLHQSRKPAACRHNIMELGGVLRRRRYLQMLACEDSLSRPAQASLTLRPAGSLRRPKATFVTRLQRCRLPDRAARQLPDQSTTLRVESSSTDDSRLRGALPIADLVAMEHASGSARETC